MNENKDSLDTTGEVDLIDIFNRIFLWFGKCFKFFGQAIIKSIAFLYHNILIVILSIVVGFLVSYILKHAEKPLYKSEITFRNNSISNADMISHFNQLGNLVMGKNTSEVSSLLDITGNEASDLVKLSAYWVIDINKDGVPDYVDYKNKHNPADTVNVRMSGRFVVEVSSLDPFNLVNIRNGLIGYAESHPLAENANAQRIRKLNELIERTNIDIRELDSLQKVKYFEETRGRMSEAGQIVLLQEQQTQMFYRDIQNLMAQRQGYETELALYPGVVSIISDFLPSSTRVNTAFYYSKVAVPCAFFLAIILLLLAKNRKRIVEVLNKYK
jgi:hypothetical protein